MPEDLVAENRNLLLAARSILNGGKPKTHLSTQEYLISSLCQALAQTTNRLEELELVYGDDS